MSKIKTITTESQDFKDAVNREEILNILKILQNQVMELSGDNLEIMKKYLRKLVDY